MSGNTGQVGMFQLGGDPGAVRASAACWTNFSVLAATAGIEIAAARVECFIGGEGDVHARWLTERFAPALSQVSDAWGQVGRALSCFADELEACQQELRHLSVMAVDDQSRVDAAGRDLAASEAQDEEQRIRLSAARVSDAPRYVSASPGLRMQKEDAEASLLAVRRRAAEVRERHEDAVRQCCCRIDQARGLAPGSQPTLDGVLDAAPGLASGGGRWLQSVSTYSDISSVTERLRTAAVSAANIGDQISSLLNGNTNWAGMPWAGFFTRSVASPADRSAGNASSRSPFKNQPASGSKPWFGWRDNGPRHKEAQLVAQKQIQAQVVAMGGDPKNVQIEFPIDGASKNDTGNKGRADIVWRDTKNRRTYIWEVKGTVNTPNSMTEYGLSAAAAKEAGEYIAWQAKIDGPVGWQTVPGFKLAHPLQVPFPAKFGGRWEMLTVKNGRDPGAIIYTTDTKHREPKPPPKMVPDPILEPVPDKVPAEPRLVPIEKPKPIFELPDWVIGGVAVVGGFLIFGPAGAFGAGAVVFGGG